MYTISTITAMIASTCTSFTVNPFQSGTARSRCTAYRLWTLLCVADDPVTEVASHLGTPRFLDGFLTGIYSVRSFDFKARNGDNMRMGRMTNEEFGEKVGCHYSMASRLRNGERLPSRDLLRRIIATFELNRIEAYEAYDHGKDGFSQYLRDAVLETPEPETDQTTPESDGGHAGSE